MRPVPARAAVAAVAVLVLATACSGDPTNEPDADLSGAELEMLPQVVSTGKKPKPSDDAQSAMTAVFDDPDEGAEVELQVTSGSQWETVDQGEQDDEGRVSFTAPYAEGGEPLTYRVASDDAGSDGVRTDAWGEAVFTEEFDGGTLDDGWFDRLQGYESKGRTCSRADASAVQVGGGVVRLGVLDDPAKGACPYKKGKFDYRLNGHIGNYFAFTYGVAAARVKFQPGQGSHGAFWMQPQSPDPKSDDPKKAGAEIDIAEYFGDDHPQGGLASFIYDPSSGKPTKVGGFVPDVDSLGRKWSQRFHTFAVRWTPEEYVFYVDGQESYRTDEGVSGTAQFPILSLLSSDYELGRSKKLPQWMEADWVKVWPQEKAQEKAQENAQKDGE